MATLWLAYGGHMACICLPHFNYLGCWLDLRQAIPARTVESASEILGIPGVLPRMLAKISRVAQALI